MRCPEANSQLQLYIDNRLSMYQVRELERHIAQCAACQQQLYLLEEVTSALRELPPVVEPIDMTMLFLVLWVGGTIIGVWITLALAGTEIRSRWLKAMMDRLPVR